MSATEELKAQARVFARAQQRVELTTLLSNPLQRPAGWVIPIAGVPITVLLWPMTVDVWPALTVQDSCATPLPVASRQNTYTWPGSRPSSHTRQSPEKGGRGLAKGAPDALGIAANAGANAPSDE